MQAITKSLIEGGPRWPLLVTTDPRHYTIVMGIQRMMAVLALLPPALVVVLMRRAFVRGLVDAAK